MVKRDGGRRWGGSGSGRDGRRVEREGGECRVYILDDIVGFESAVERVEIDALVGRGDVRGRQQQRMFEQRAHETRKELQAR